MPLIIRNISDGPTPIQRYSVGVNDQPTIAQFSFDRSLPMGDCLRAAAAAVDVAQGRAGKPNADFWAGVAWAVNQLRGEGADLLDIRDGYIEARTTGVHGGRKIDPNFAKECAVKFGERSDAVYMAADSLQRAVDEKSTTVK